MMPDSSNLTASLQEDIANLFTLTDDIIKKSNDSNIQTTVASQIKQMNGRVIQHVRDAEVLLKSPGVQNVDELLDTLKALNAVISTNEKNNSQLNAKISELNFENRDIINTLLDSLKGTGRKINKLLESSSVAPPKTQPQSHRTPVVPLGSRAQKQLQIDIKRDLGFLANRSPDMSKEILNKNIKKDFEQAAKLDVSALTPDDLKTFHNELAKLRNAYLSQKLDIAMTRNEVDNLLKKFQGPLHVPSQVPSRPPPPLPPTRTQPTPSQKQVPASKTDEMASLETPTEKKERLPIPEDKLDKHEHRFDRSAPSVERSMKRQLKLAAEQKQNEPQGHAVGYDFETGNKTYAPSPVPKGKDLGILLSLKPTELMTGRHENKNFTCSIAEAKGARPTMEDSHKAGEITFKVGGNNYTTSYFSLFDGHAGSECAKFAAANIPKILQKQLEDFHAKSGSQELSEEAIYNALKATFVTITDEFLEKYPHDKSGSTAVLALPLGNRLYIANAGDSRAILVPDKGEVKQLSKDAEPDDPQFQAGIKRRGGTVAGGGVWSKSQTRRLAVGQALGDQYFPGMSSRPKITSVPIEELDNAFLSLMCDGITDIASSDEIGEAIREFKGDAANLLKFATYYNTEDNTSAMIIRLKK